MNKLFVLPTPWSYSLPCLPCHMDCVSQAVIYNRALPVFVSDRHSVMAVRKVTDNTQQGPPLISCSFKLVALFFLVIVWGDQGRVSLKLNVINDFFFFFFCCHLVEVSY